MNPIKLDELKRRALRCGRGEECVVDAEDLLELLTEVELMPKRLKEAADKAFADGYEDGELYGYCDCGCSEGL